MSYAPTGEPLVSLFDSIGIIPKVVESAVAIMYPQFQDPKLDLIINQMIGGTIVKSDNRKFFVYRQGNDYPKATIQTRTTVGTALRIICTEPDFSAISTGNLVYGDSGVMAKATYESPGQYLLTFISKPDGATSFVAADFAATESMIDGGDSGNILSRNSKTTQFSVPDPFEGVIQTMNNSAFISYDEQHTKTYLPASNGKQMYAYQKEAQALLMIRKQYIKRMYSNTPMVKTGNEPVSASPLNQILTMGGLVSSLAATATFTGQQFRNKMRNYISQGGFSTNEIIGVVGPDWMGNFQEAFEDSNMKYVGVNNTVGGREVKGINFNQYAFMGMDVKLVVEPILADQKMFPSGTNGRSARSNTAIFMNTAPVQTTNSGPIPFATSRYFGSSADIQRAVVLGVTNENGVSSGNSATNSQKGVSYEYWLDKMTQLSNPAACWYDGN